MEGDQKTASSNIPGETQESNATRVTSHTDPFQEVASAGTSEGPEFNTSGIRPLHRSSTTPTTRRRDFAAGTGTTTEEDTSSPSRRRRGQTMASRDPHPLAFNPRASGSRRPEDSLENIPEEERIRMLAETQKIGTSSSRDSRHSVSGARRRAATTSVSRPRQNTITRRPTLLTQGGGPDAQSTFSLAGPSDAPATNQHQPYVDPGYAQLNPAYEQPVNSRPIWGLAKPLPRVVRPGMVPTPAELTPAEDAELENRQEFPIDPDIERGRVEPTFNLGKVSSQLNDAREQREANFLQRRGSRTIPPSSSLSQITSQQSVRRESTHSVQPPLTPHVEEPEAEAVADENASQISPGASPAKPSFSFKGRPSLTQGRPEPTEQLPATHEGYDKDDVSEAATEIDDARQWYDEDLNLAPYGPEDEVFNHHTHWSVIRTRFREPLAELLAVTVQLTLGFCADLANTTSSGSSLDAGSTDLAWGLATMIGIYIAGGISGAHLNPAISIMLWIYRGFPLRKVPGYVAANILGAFIAALIAFGLYRTGVIAYGGADLATGGTANSFLTNPRYEYIDASTAFFTEFTATAILAIVVLAVGDDTNAPPGAGMSAFVMGLVITCECMAFSHNTGNAMNPSRDFGPRLALLAVGYGSGVFRNAWWVYGPWCATISGAIIGAALYDAAIFVGGESPINYPRRRIKRAGRKWRRKWARRLHIRKAEGNYGKRL